MAKADTIKDIKTANGQDVPDSLKQAELDELLTLAKKDGSGNLDAFTSRLTELTASTSTTESESKKAEAPKEKTISVRVNDTIAAFGGEFVDPENRKVIGKKAVDVPRTAFVREKLRTEELVEE
ncbi:hypothetical protein [Deinococcus sp. Leaf326]|uniref:hypothetical protein n=1 Tax=Deinococcus sp. Leaf326 TaxID=1736338 RepID=UPI0006F48CEC|nr:hypothetical protein [Deinococcus sp. Leaf326]KQR33127.1 hypothetical protein ASF71_16685 [Deinococcus sp. Leaf326]